MAILPKFVGARIKRREDPALIQGLGQYVDDIPMAGTLHAAFLRSPYAHARITGLHGGGPAAPRGGRRPDGARHPWQGGHYSLCGGGLWLETAGAACPGRRQGGACRPASGRGGGGEPSTAQDAVDLIAMDVELLPAVVDPEQAGQPGASKVHDDFDDNVMFHLYGPAHPPSLTRWA